MLTIPFYVLKKSDTNKSVWLIYDKLSESLGCRKKAPDRVWIGQRTHEAKV